MVLKRVLVLETENKEGVWIKFSSKVLSTNYVLNITICYVFNNTGEVYAGPSVLFEAEPEDKSAITFLYCYVLSSARCESPGNQIRGETGATDGIFSVSSVRRVYIPYHPFLESLVYKQ